MSYFVYVVSKLENNELVAPSKIGISSDPAKRVATLRTAAPFKIQLVGQFWCPSPSIARDIERFCHDFSRHLKVHSHGEWVNLHSADALMLVCQAIRSLMNKLSSLEGEDLQMALEAIGVLAVEKRLKQHEFVTAEATLQ